MIKFNKRSIFESDATHKTVHMKNGRSFRISKGNANILRDAMVENNAQFQSFSDGDDIFLMINMQEVSYID
jgi:hypothetical protein